MHEPAAIQPAPDPDRYRLDPLTAEFLYPATEQDFRVYIRDRRVRDTRQAVVLAACIYLAFALTDYLAMGAGRDWLLILAIRLAVCGLGLFAVTRLERHWERLVDGRLPSMLVMAGMLGFLAITLLRPYEPGWHGMSMMAMLLGAYVFIPNRFLPALVICLCATAAFLLLMTAQFRLSGREVLHLGGLLGVLNLLGAATAYRFSRLIHEEYRDAALLGAGNARLRREAEERRALERSMREQADRDETTGILNRRRFHELAEPALRAAAEAGTPRSLLLIDVDFLRQVNVTYGHLRGDQVLRMLVTVCRRHLGDSALLARYGGEECVALIEEGAETAAALAGRICEEVRRSPVEVTEAAIFFTVSIGVAEARPGDPVNVLLRRADEALSAARFRGRNRVERAA